MKATQLVNLDSAFVPVGYCACGCGHKTALAFKTDHRFGWVKGQPLKWLVGHTSRKATRYTINTVTGCWDWNLNKDSGGYGRVFFEGRCRYAHVVMYELKYGKKLKGHELDHLCRNRSCVNPEHLELVLPAVNVRRSTVAKLTEGQVRQIRALHHQGNTYRDIALRFGINWRHVGSICRHEFWKGID